jgi:predicted MFS family arabinose efflux permease
MATSSVEHRWLFGRQVPVPSLGDLWRHADFMNLWAAHSASLFGSEITALALPLMAVIMLDATPVQMGVLAAAGTAPFLLCSLPAGVWVDRRRRRPVLIGGDLARAGFLLSIPLAAWMGVLRMEHLYLVTFLVGVFSVFFEVADYAYVPSLVGREAVVDANSKLQISYSAAEAGGPGVAGLLVQVISAPGAIAIDAVSYLVSAILLRRIEMPEPPIDTRTSRGVRHDVESGLRALLGHRLLRPIVLAPGADSIFLKAIAAIFVLYATRELEITPVMLGVILAVGGIGAIPGALLSASAARRFGVGSTIIGGWLIAAATWLMVPLATGAVAVPVLAVSMLLGGIAGTIVNVQQWSLRQLVTPDALQGRVTASHRFLVYGAYPLGALLGGWLGAVLGLRPAIALCALGALTAPLWVACSPLRALREQPVASRVTPGLAGALPALLLSFGRQSVPIAGIANEGGGSCASRGLRSCPRGMWSSERSRTSSTMTWSPTRRRCLSTSRSRSSPS